MRKLYVSNVSSFREQSDIAAETNITVGDILSARAIEALHEYKVLFGEPSAASTASSTADAAVVAQPAAEVDAVVDAVPKTVVGEAPGGRG